MNSYLQPIEKLCCFGIVLQLLEGIYNIVANRVDDNPSITVLFMTSQLAGIMFCRIMKEK